MPTYTSRNVLGSTSHLGWWTTLPTKLGIVGWTDNALNCASQGGHSTPNQPAWDGEFVWIPPGNISGNWQGGYWVPSHLANAGTEYWCDYSICAGQDMMASDNANFPCPYDKGPGARGCFIIWDCASFRWKMDISIRADCFYWQHPLGVINFPLTIWQGYLGTANQCSNCSPVGTYIGGGVLVGGQPSSFVVEDRS